MRIISKVNQFSINNCILQRLFIVLLFLPLSKNVSGQSVIIDGISYNIYGEFCSVYKGNNGIGGNIVIPPTIDWLGKTYPVKRVNSSAFLNCKDLISIVLPEGVTEIGEKAFSGCTNLISVSLPSSLKYIEAKSFYECSSLNSINIPESVKSIGNYAFNGCKKLKRITIPSSVTTIGNYAFQDCNELIAVKISGVVNSLGSGVFQGCTSLTDIKLPQELKTIGPYCFSGCTNLQNIELPQQLETIEKEAFNDCQNLKSIKIPNSVTNIGVNCLSGCSALEEISIPFVGTESNPDSPTPNALFGKIFSDTSRPNHTKVEQRLWVATNTYCDVVSYIPSGLSKVVVTGNCNLYFAFRNCTSIKEVELSGDLTTIGNSSFENCTNLERVSLSNTIDSIGFKAFYGCKNLNSITIPQSVGSIEGRVFQGCSALSNIIIPESVNSIGFYAFNGCKKLKRITIPSSVTTIGDYAFQDCNELIAVKISGVVNSFGSGVFQGCTSLTDIKLPQELKTTGPYCFSGCTNLQNIELPQQLETIDSYCFSGCTNLQNIELPQQLETIGSRAFNDCQNLKSIIIPNSVTNIGAYCLSGCSALEEVSIPFVGIERNPKGSTQNTLFGCIFSDTSRPGHTEVNQKYMITSTSWSGKVSYIPSGLSKVVVTGNSNLFFAFHNCSMIKNVEISGCLTAIGESSFENCTNLERVTLSNIILGIGKNAFYGCEKLDSITIPQYVNSISSGAFNGCPLKYVKIESPDITLANIGTQVANCVIGGNVTDIKRLYFLNCRNLSSVTIEEGCSRVEHEAFYNTTISRLYLPKSISFLGVKYSSSIYGLSYRGMEEDWNNIENYLEMSPSVFHYGIIIPGEEFNKDGIYYCANDTLPATVSVISGVEPYSQNIFIPSNVTMEGRTFKITHIADNAFNGCEKLDTIFYGGNRIEWQKLYFGKNNDVLFNIPIVYNYHRETSEEVSPRNYIYIGNTTINTNSTPFLSIQLKNADAITGFQFELELPQGFDIAKDEKGNYKVKLSPDRSSVDKQNIFEVSRLSNGRYLFLCSSTSNNVFDGNDGEILSVELTIDDDLTNGEYQVTLNNTSIADIDANVYRAEKRQFPVSLISYIVGDVNDDASISITDVICIVSHVLNKTPDVFIPSAADINNDGEITITDAVTLMDVILGKQNN